MKERHPFDPFSLVFGVFFTAFAAVFTFSDAEVVDLDPSGAVAIALLFLGALLLAVVWKRMRPNVSPDSEPDETLPTQPPPPS